MNNNWDEATATVLKIECEEVEEEYLYELAEYVEVGRDSLSEVVVYLGDREH